MGFVPGLRNDVFISYSHADNTSEWVTELHRELQTELDQTLPQRTLVFRDGDRHNNETIRGGEDIPSRLQAELYDSAVLVCVVSPPYLASSYCTKEREWFAASARQRADRTREVHSRIIKVLKRSDQAGSHQHLFPQSMERDFRDPASPGGRFEHAAGSAAFRSEVQTLALDVEARLQSMKRELPGVYLAPCKGDAMIAVRDQLKEQLLRDQFNVFPDLLINPHFDDAAIVAVLNRPECVMTVHIFGNEYDEESRRHADLARRQGKPAFVWANIDPADCDTAQCEFLDNRCGYGTYRQLVAYLDIKATQPDFVREVRAAAATHACPPPSDGELVYVICDTARDTELADAQQISAAISAANASLRVWTPPDSNLAEHYERLKSSRAVILYRGSTPPEWFSGHYDDVRRQVRRRPGVRAGVYLRAGAVLPVTVPPVPDSMLLRDIGDVRNFVQGL
jgi:hypothetical protein